MWGIKQLGILAWDLSYSGPEVSYMTFCPVPLIGAAHHAQPQGASLCWGSS